MDHMRAVGSSYAYAPEAYPHAAPPFACGWWNICVRSATTSVRSRKRVSAVGIPVVRARVPVDQARYKLQTQRRTRDRMMSMGRKVTELLREAAELPENERAELAGRLLETLESEHEEGVEAAWAEEIERRVRQLDAGEVRTIPWEQVRSELYARLNEER